MRTAKGPERLGKTAAELALFLKRFGSFGARRGQCWQRLLELPEDREAYVPCRPHRPVRKTYKAFNCFFGGN